MKVALLAVPLALLLALSSANGVAPARNDALALTSLLDDPIAFVGHAWGAAPADVPAVDFVTAASLLASSAKVPFNPLPFAAFAAANPAQAAALAPLLSSTAVALGLSEAALADLSPEEFALLRDHPDWLAPSGSYYASRGSAPASAMTDEPDREALLAAAAKVDVAELGRAALTVGQGALDALDGLTITHPTGTVLDQCPLLRVYDSVNDAHTSADDACIVVVDLGGDDSYAGRSGSAQGVLGTPATLVRVLVDAAGTDSYTNAATGPAAVVAQGAAVLGVGVLVDAQGSDTYTVTSTGTAGGSGSSCAAVGSVASAIAQGAASTGAGLLLDLAGSDSRQVVVKSFGNTASAIAQGAGSLGLGGLVDDAVATLDGAANDANLARADSVIWQVNANLGCIGAGTVAAQGGAVLGAGAKGDGLGNDGDTAIATGGAALTVAQGAANGGVGVLADAAGNDARTAIALGDLKLIGGGPGPCWSSVTVFVITGSTFTVAQGGAVLGVGILADAAGSDSYSSDAVMRAEARALAPNTCSFIPTATATVTSGGAESETQGGASTGVALLLDGAGTDSYSAHAEATTLAEALATSPSGSGTATATASGGAALSYSQADVEGLGVGGLADGVGSDSYSHAASSTVTEIENGATSTTSGATRAGLGAGNGKCWTNAPPGLLALHAGVGIGLDGDPATLTGCVLPPW